MTTAQMIEHASAGLMSITPEQAEGFWLARAGRLVDVRESDELVEHGWIAGSVHVPRGLLEFRADPTCASYQPELDPAVPTVIYDTAGHRAVLAARTLADLGYEQVAFLAGGFAGWVRAGLPVMGPAGAPGLSPDPGPGLDDVLVSQFINKRSAR